MKKALFIDRDGTIIVEPPITFQVDNLEQMQFLPKVIRNLFFIREKLDFEFVMVSNQDGLGTPSNPQENFDLVQGKMLQILKGEGVEFDDILIDGSLPEDNSPTRKPRTGLLKKYMTGEYDLANSFVIGDRMTDVELAKNLGCKAIFLENAKAVEFSLKEKGLDTFCALITNDWNAITEFLFAGERCATVQRKTKETDILVQINLDGRGKTNVATGLGFFDHMLEQIGKHSGMDLTISVKGDLSVDEHHTIDVNKSFNIEHEINNYRNQLKNQNVLDVNNKEYDYQMGAHYMDIITECEKLGDYVVNVVEAGSNVKEKKA